MNIRPELPDDIPKIRDLTIRAFARMPFSNGSEAPIIEKLRRDGDLTLSLVAEIDNDLVGHIAFSPVTIGNMAAQWFGLGPVSAEPARQKQGIGSALINAGLAHIKEIGARGCALIGDPAYYQRFGFKSTGDVTYGDVPAPYVQWLSFSDEDPAGAIQYAPAFDRTT